MACKKYKKRRAKQAVYRCLRDFFGGDRPWGSLTGVRPTKLYRETPDAKAVFLEEFDVSTEKTALVRKICAIQRSFIESVAENDLDVYIGIPFCASKCAYCSFASSVATKTGQRERAYVDALLSELSILPELARGKRIRSVYIGGGTPTALAPAELERVLDAAMGIGAPEFTVEAGRPDTITPEKLKLIRQSGSNRISVNCQTTRDETLQIIGRAHTAADFFRAFALAAACGFENVNTDLILGLPGEDGAAFMHSLDDVLSLQPENITVHTLAIKRASEFGMRNVGRFLGADAAQRLLSQAHTALEAAGYEPYYMYRQKYMTGNMENVGYARSGKCCVYNIDMMEETASILSFGAGAMSKRVFPAENRIERAANVKDISLYIERWEEMAARKAALFALR